MIAFLRSQIETLIITQFAEGNVYHKTLDKYGDLTRSKMQ